MNILYLWRPKKTSWIKWFHQIYDLGILTQIQKNVQLEFRQLLKLKIISGWVSNKSLNLKEFSVQIMENIVF